MTAGMNMEQETVAYRDPVFDPDTTGLDFDRLGLAGAMKNAASVLARLKEHDELTYRHSVSVANSILGFSRRIGLDEKTCAVYYIGGLVHDIGKLDVPAELLNKNGRLSASEEKIMRRHAWSRIDELKTLFPSLPDVAIMSEYHHLRTPDAKEMPDYDRLYGDMADDEVKEIFYSTADTSYSHEFRKGENIPLCAQIIALADVYDATIAARSYKNGMGLVQSLGELKKGPADPDLVSAFTEMQIDNVLGQSRTFTISAPDMENLTVFQDNTVDPDFRNAIYSTISGLADQAAMLTGDTDPVFDIAYTRGEVIHLEGHPVASNVVVSMNGYALAEVSDGGGDYHGKRDVSVRMEHPSDITRILCGAEPTHTVYDPGCDPGTDDIPLDIADETVEL